MVRIAVIGAGLLGTKVAGELAYHGHTVRVYDASMDRLNAVFDRLEEDKRELRAEGLLPHAAFPGRVLCLSQLPDAVYKAQFVFETVPEDLAVKHRVLSEVRRHCPPDAIIASSTLRLPVDRIFERASDADDAEDGVTLRGRDRAKESGKQTDKGSRRLSREDDAAESRQQQQQAEHQERCLGVRFLFPVYYIPEVEVTLASRTSTATLEMVRIFLERMGKTVFFRSGREPLVLSDEQRDARKRARLAQIRKHHGLATVLDAGLPFLSHRGNVQPAATQGASLLSGGQPSSNGTAESGARAGGDPESGAAADSSGGGDTQESDCAICMDRARNCVLRPCCHMCTCVECGRLLLNRKDGCPICRKDIKEIIRVFHS